MTTPPSPRKLVSYDTPLYQASVAQTQTNLRPDEINGFVSDPTDIPKSSSWCNCLNKSKHKKQPTRIDIVGKVSSESSKINKEHVK